jgi:hypothetical protein
MCWVLYLAADRPLRLRAFDPGAPAFNVADPTGREIAVRGQFSKAFVYALGAHTSCGCGFDRDQVNPDHPGELEATEASLRALHAYLGEALELAGPLELFACWDGDQGAIPDHRWKYRLTDFGPDMAWFPDRTFIEVTPGARCGP